MPWQQRIWQMIGRPVGISLRNGQGVSGILCNAERGVLYVMEYLYQDQFALKQYRFEMVQDVNPFPPCRRGPQPRPLY